MNEAKRTIGGEKLKKEILKIIPFSNTSNKGGMTMNVIVRKLLENFQVRRQEVEQIIKKMVRKSEISSRYNSRFAYYSKPSKKN